MESNPKIIVLQLKEVLYTVIFVILAILLIILLVFIFLPKHKDSEPAAPAYNAGSYTASITMNGIPMEIVVTVDDNYIKSISLNNVNDTITTMYPLLVPSLNDISSQIIKTQSTENIYCNEDNLYTGTVILTGINAALEKASTP